ncbi:MAG: glycosyltransferase family A protein [Bacteroidia bacterium]|nr:glycosyltransferase family A protein [Bacteroidia bacterium]
MISVVIPLYNKEKSIQATLESVLSQEYRDFEVVVVDDGSTDRSAEIVKKIEDSRIRIIRKENGGVSSARNAGIIAARGEYIAFLDGDDWWRTDYLGTLVQLISDYPNASLYCLRYKSIEKECDISSIEADELHSDFRGLIDDVWRNYPNIWTGCCCSSKKKLIEVGLFDMRMTHGEDIDMWWRLLLNGKCVVDNTKIVAYYIQDAENRAMNKVIPFEKHIPFYIEKYEKWRKENAGFRKFCDREFLYRMFQYTLMPQYKNDLKRVLGQIDFSQQKLSMRLRFVFPRLYRLHLRYRHG